MAAARAISVTAGVPLWSTFASPGTAPRLPVPHFNVVNGGVHAPNELDFQGFMLAPLGAPSEAEAVRAGAEVYAALKPRTPLSPTLRWAPAAANAQLGRGAFADMREICPGSFAVAAPERVGRVCRARSGLGIGGPGWRP